MAKINRARRRQIREAVRKAVAEKVLAMSPEEILPGNLFNNLDEEEQLYAEREIRELSGRIDYKPTESEPESE